VERVLLEGPEWGAKPATAAYPMGRRLRIGGGSPALGSLNLDQEFRWWQRCKGCGIAESSIAAAAGGAAATPCHSSNPIRRATARRFGPLLNAALELCPRRCLRAQPSPQRSSAPSRPLCRWTRFQRTPKKANRLKPLSQREALTALTAELLRSVVSQNSDRQAPAGGSCCLSTARLPLGK
jgi:hypothetical protein